MKRLLLLPVLIFVLSANCLTASAGSVQEQVDQSRQAAEAGRVDQSVKHMQEALHLIWQRADLWVETAVLVDKPGGGFGMYETRPDNVFAINEPIRIYMEPMGYRHRKREDGKYEYGVQTDLIVKRPNGEIIAGKKGFSRLAMVSKRPNRELMLNLTYNVSGLPPGEYVLETVLHDLVDQSTTSVDTTIVIKK